MKFIDKNRDFFLNILLRFGFLISFIIITQFTGEFHPFSRFPMFSSFPKTSQYYYLADSENLSRFTQKKSGVFCSEISDLIQVQVNSSSAIDSSDNVEITAALKVINALADKYSEKECWAKSDEVRLRKKTFFQNNNQVVFKDTLLALWRKK
jgi:hypothetical protein